MCVRKTNDVYRYVCVYAATVLCAHKPKPNSRRVRVAQQLRSRATRQTRALYYRSPRRLSPSSALSRLTSVNDRPRLRRFSAGSRPSGFRDETSREPGGEFSNQVRQHWLCCLLPIETDDINKMSNVDTSEFDDSVTDNKSVSGTIEFSHEELVKLTKEAIDKIIESDPLLSGIPPDATVEEVRSQAAVAQGQAITLYLNRGELPRLAVVVPPHNMTVLDLKKAIKRHTILALKREKVAKKISWKHVWKKYNICFGSTQLINDNENIKTYGLSNRIELHYAKKRREKNKVVET